MKKQIALLITGTAIACSFLAGCAPATLSPAEYTADSAAEHATNYVTQIIELQKSPYPAESSTTWGGIITEHTLQDEELHTQYNQWARENEHSKELFKNIKINYHPKPHQPGIEVITGMIYRGLADGTLNYDFNIKNLPENTAVLKISARGMELTQQTTTATDLSTSYELYDNGGNLTQTIPANELVKKLKLKYENAQWFLYFDMDNY